MNSVRKSFFLCALACWVLMGILLFVVVPVGTFVVPAMVNGWKASGLREAPLFWQIVIDLCDMTKHLWFIIFPGLLVLSIVFTIQAARRYKD